MPGGIFRVQARWFRIIPCYQRRDRDGDTKNEVDSSDQMHRTAWGPRYHNSGLCSESASGGVQAPGSLMHTDRLDGTYARLLTAACMCLIKSILHVLSRLAPKWTQKYRSSRQVDDGAFILQPVLGGGRTKAETNTGYWVGWKIHNPFLPCINGCVHMLHRHNVNCIILQITISCQQEPIYG